MMGLAKGLSVLLIFSKNQLLVSLIFFLLFSSCLIIFISALIFVISFFLLTLGFGCSFSSCFKSKVRLFEIFISWGGTVFL